MSFLTMLGKISASAGADDFGDALKDQAKDMAVDAAKD